MTRSVPTALQTHLDTGSTTLCYLLKIAPQNATAFGVTSLDKDVSYDDGGGAITYSAATGMNPTATESSGGLAVNNSEAMLLISSQFSKSDINAGVLDYANFYVYRINWDDTSQGHYLVQSGTTGIVRSNNELSGVIELRGFPQMLKQNFIDLYSLTCRATFGSTTGEERFPCMYDASGLWQNNTVASVGTETDREFVCTTTPSAAAGNFDTALIEFLTGSNAGLTVETETVNTSTNAIALRFSASYAIEVGDTFKMRPDCAKRFTEDCVGLYSNGANFRGEPLIPITEEASSGTPGANIPGVGGHARLAVSS